MAAQDITVGTWMLGLDVEFVDERRMCCANAEACHKQVRWGHVRRPPCMRHPGGRSQNA